MKRTVIINCCIGLLFSTSVSAEIYRSQDRDGTVTFSDKPTVTSTRVSSQTQAYRYFHTVVKVYDGDTIVLKNGERVRLLGINTPEIKSRHRQGEKGGQTAKTWLETKLKQGQVYLEYDHTQRDKYKRLLAHCFLPDGEHLNETILEAGLASLTIIPPNVRYSDRLIAAQSLAEQNKRGIWGQTEYKPRLISALGKVDNHIGWQRFLATPSKLKYSRSFVRLILTDKVDVRIPKENLHLFPDLDRYLGKTLEIRGWPSKQKGYYSILVRHPSAIIF